MKAFFDKRNIVGKFYKNPYNTKVGKSNSTKRCTRKIVAWWLQNDIMKDAC